MDRHGNIPSLPTSLTCPVIYRDTLQCRKLRELKIAYGGIDSLGTRGRCALSEREDTGCRVFGLARGAVRGVVLGIVLGVVLEVVLGVVVGVVVALGV